MLAFDMVTAIILFLQSCALTPLLEKLLQATHVSHKPLELIQGDFAVVVQVLDMSMSVLQLQR